MSKVLPTRALNEDFLKDFLDDGILSPLLTLVHNDNTLCMELRGNRVVIYYRGGLLYEIIKNTDNNSYNISYNKDYIREEDAKGTGTINTVTDAVNEVAKHKHDMDIYFTNNPKFEREYQQLIVRDNNFAGKISHATDYFILDIEYAFNDNGIDDNINARFDMLAVKWLSTSGERKKVDKLPLVFIEIKYGDDAVSGKAGIKKHIKDYITFRKKKDEMKQLADDMANVFKQKRTLGLIPIYDEKKLSSVTLDPDNVEFIFIFANHDPDKTKLFSEITEAIKECKGEPEERFLSEIKIAKASEMGNGLFAYKNGKESLYPTVKEYVKI